MKCGHDTGPEKQGHQREGVVACALQRCTYCQMHAEAGALMCRQAAPAKNKARTAAKQARQDYTLALMPHMGDLLRLSQTSGGRVCLLILSVG